jgi:hypothetical protein
MLALQAARAWTSVAQRADEDAFDRTVVARAPSDIRGACIDGADADAYSGRGESSRASPDCMHLVHVVGGEPEQRASRASLVQRGSQLGAGRGLR